MAIDQQFLKNNKLVVNTAWILGLVLVFLWAVNFFNIAYPLTVTSKQSSGELAVVGVGKVDTTPDTASVDLGIVVNDAATIEAVSTQINKVNNDIVAGLAALGIDKKDIKTSNYSINPNYDYSRVPNGTITGYNGNTTVTIKVTDTSKLPLVIEAGTKAGANQVMGTNYTIDKPEDYQEQARAKAIANAKEQASKMAKELGIRLGRVVNIVESSTGNGTYPMYFEKAVALDSRGGSNAPVPDLQPGTQTITSTVTLYFETK